MKPYLLIAGEKYYPSYGTDDWKRCYATKEEAEAAVKKVEQPTYYTSGKMKGKLLKVFVHYEIDGGIYDWYDIVDLREWMNR
jgi:hypothetical protein